MSKEQNTPDTRQGATLEACPKCGGELYFYPACNEDGWRCCSDACGHKPGEPPGFDPRRDRELISLKVHGLLLDLHGRDFIHCSNSGHGDSTVDYAVERCRETGRFDMYSIIQFMFEGRESHGEYWKRISEGVLEGEDPRDRCSNGNLANMWTGGMHYCCLSGCGCQDGLKWAGS